MSHPSPEPRRQFLQHAGALAGTLSAPAWLAACASTASTPSDPTQLTSAQAIAQIKGGQIKAVDYVAALVARARALQSLNALITLDEAGALAAARRIDAARASGAALGPLAGLVIVVKDNINTADLPTTGGTPALQGFKPPRTAPSLQKLIDAGVIVLGKANLHELAFGITSTNFAPFAGAVGNPYDPTRIPGGSSGGTAAAIAARMVAAGLGTDTGGSTRVPAALCGIVGLRPSVGNGGAERRYHDPLAVVPISHTRDTVGPMGRTVADVALLDAVITGDASLPAMPLARVRLGLPRPLWAGLDASLAAVVNAALAKLRAAGATLVEVDMAQLLPLNEKMSFQIALHEPVADLPAYLAANNAPVKTVAEVAAQVASPDVQGAFGAIKADAFGPAYPEAMAVHRPQLQALYASTFAQGRLDALLFPTTPLPAVPMDKAKGSSTVKLNGGADADTFATFIRNTDPGSNAGIPGLSVPAGLTSAGLPVGLEIDGPVGSDRRLLAIGLEIEKVLGSVPAPRI
ncbi:amidase, Asp-tRNAAsn/Glu-tRNAGln amidotransferase A subunit [Acidovorax sp. CF316]|uniref:indoleacetamide hydrolase n=1 Tax=Acidovorax sp. CF316 TaxID=1144317 RepID=UPI00026BD81F|nr:indoleacetamide hydrolase [Acidovorax sp. CF316]EJE50040.1 amidase, Asp-tRNAAsn/Glu-tRNAGln amidotransferase A subunit [Acidovorax sp. CF316]